MAKKIIYANVLAGHAISSEGELFSFPANCSLPDVLASLQGHVFDRLFVCGELPTDYTSWLIHPEMWQAYTTGKRGHYFDAEKDANHVARYAHQATGKELEIRTMYSWFGDSAYTVEQARLAMILLDEHLKSAFTDQVQAYATPALTFQQCWLLTNRLAGKKFEVLPDEIRSLIHSTTGQGRIELCTPPDAETIPGLYYYDGVFMYSALTWGMPTEIETHDTVNEYAGKVPARYRIRYTVPANWQHVGLFMTSKEQVTGLARDSHAWCYPGRYYQGRTFETWVDGSELDVAYNLPAGMPAWDITILERIVYKAEKDSVNTKPLDSITKRLTTMRDRVEAAAAVVTDESLQAVYQLVRGAIRNILLHGIGSFHRHNRDITYILGIDEEAPAGFTERREIDEHTVWYSVPQQTERYTQQFEHPEWTALIWARCRARMTRAALGLPPDEVVAFRTDALAVTKEQSQWASSDKRGQLRQKLAIKKKLKAPHTFEALDSIMHKYQGGK